MTDHNFPVRGKFIEILGSFDPRSDKVELKKERVEYWLKSGAKVSQTVKEMLKKQKVTGKLEVLNRKDRAQTTKKGAEPVKPATEAPKAEEKKNENKESGIKNNETPAKPEEKK